MDAKVAPGRRPGRAGRDRSSVSASDLGGTGLVGGPIVAPKYFPALLDVLTFFSPSSRVFDSVMDKGNRFDTAPCRDRAL
jgi:hypothetical protein